MYTRTDQLHFDNEIPILRSYIENVAINWYKSAKKGTNS